MRIEILIGNSEEPLIFPLNKPKLIIGSGEACDIIIDAANISRKHLQIITEADNFFVIDQGSTNGTFINEERLVPGRRTEFTSFFPVRLGDEVLITLLSDEEAPQEEENSLKFPEASAEPPVSPRGRRDEDSTKMISLRDLQKAKTSDLVSRRQAIVKKKASEPKSKTGPKSKRLQDRSRMRRIQLMVFFLLAGAAYVNFFVIETGDRVAKIGEEIPLDPKDIKPPEPKPEPPVSKLIADTEITPREKVQNLVSDIKCTLDVEIYFCNTIPDAKASPQAGAVQVGTMINILSDGTYYYQSARKFLQLPPTASPTGQHTPEELLQYEKGLEEVMAALYLLRGVPTLDEQRIKDLKMTFGLFLKDEQGNMQLKVAIAILPEGLKEFKRVFEEQHLQNVTKIGTGAITFARELYRVY